MTNLKPLNVLAMTYLFQHALCLIYVLNLSSLFEVLWHIGSKELGYKRTYCVPEGSILGSILFKILTWNIFLLKKSFGIATCVGDNTPYISKSAEDLVKTDF